MSILSRFSSQMGFQLSTTLTHFAFRSFSTLENRIICKCGVEIPDLTEMTSLFKERKLRELYGKINCPNLNKTKFTEDRNCALSDAIAVLGQAYLPTFEDVAYLGNHLVSLQALRPVPDGDRGDSRGDHGKQLAHFLKNCIDDQLIGEVGTLFDIGGHSNSTIKIISNILNKETLPSIIIDINSVTPAISSFDNKIKYAIGDAYSFFLSDSYSILEKNTISEKPSLYIFNNILNVLKAEAGWATLEIVWEKMRTGDYLVISGLALEEFSGRSLRKGKDIDGIIEYHSLSGFYKSALSAEFFEYIPFRLKDAQVLIEESFRFPVEGRKKEVQQVKGRRLLTLKKL